MDSRLFVALSLCFLFFSPGFSRSSIRLPGKEQMNASVLSANNGGSSVALDPTRVTQLSWNPRAFHFKGFLSEEECDHLITLAKDKLEISMVADNESGESIKSEVRTSSGMFLSKAQDHIVAEIEARIAAWTFLPVENGESIQILHYEQGQKYEPHYDYFQDKANQELGGHRIATVLMYLSNVKKGGETIFPNSEAKMSRKKHESWSDCARKGNAVKTVKGDALLFFSLHPDATTDTSSLHGSCPVTEGEKWSATKWIHVRSFEKPLRGGECTDEHEKCPTWAKRGECEKNPIYMIGDKDIAGRVAKPAHLKGLHFLSSRVRLFFNFMLCKLSDNLFASEFELLTEAIQKIDPLMSKMCSPVVLCLCEA